MIEVRTKDKVFIAAVLPIALIGAYVHFCRIPQAKKNDSLASRHLSLVAVEDFPFEKRRAESALADAQTELEAEKNVPCGEMKVVSKRDDSFADRESAVLKVLRDSGLIVLRSEMLPGGGRADSLDPRDTIWRANGWRRGWCAECRRYTLDGTYPAVKRALDSFAAGKMPVIVQKVDMREDANSRWSLEVWL